MRTLLESISNFSVADPKAPKAKTAKPEDNRVDDEDDGLAEALMQEYKYFVKEAEPTAPPVAGQAPASGSPVAAVNPPGTGNPAVAGAPATNTATSQTGAATKPGAPAAPAAPGTPPPKPGAPAAGTVTPPNPQQVKQQTDTLTKLLNNPAHPMNAELQALIKKAGSIPG